MMKTLSLGYLVFGYLMSILLVLRQNRSTIVFKKMMEEITSLSSNFFTFSLKFKFQNLSSTVFYSFCRNTKNLFSIVIQFPIIFNLLVRKGYFMPCFIGNNI